MDKLNINENMLKDVKMKVVMEIFNKKGLFISTVFACLFQAGTIYSSESSFLYPNRKYEVPQCVYKAAKKHLLTFHKLFPTDNTQKEIDEKQKNLKIYQGYDPSKLFQKSKLMTILTGTSKVRAYAIGRKLYFSKGSFNKNGKIKPLEDSILCHEVGHIHKEHSTNTYEDEKENQSRTVQVLCKQEKFDAIKAVNYLFSISVLIKGLNPYTIGHMNGLHKVYAKDKKNNQKNNIVNHYCFTCSYNLVEETLWVSLLCSALYSAMNFKLPTKQSFVNDINIATVLGLGGALVANCAVKRDGKSIIKSIAIAGTTYLGYIWIKSFLKK